MTQRPTIWGGDLLRALSRLGVTDLERADRIFECLGLERHRERLTPDTPPPPPEPPPPPPPRDETPKRRGANEPPPGAKRQWSGSRIDELETEPPRPLPAWLQRAGAMDEVKLPYEPEPPVPLFPMHSERGVLIATASTWTTSREVDVAAVLERIVNHRPLDVVPMVEGLSMRHGVRLLVDRGEGMLPYRVDQRRVREALEDLVHDLEVVAFTGDPRRPRRPRRRDDRPVLDPSSGTAVVALTDLGIAERPDSASTATWVSWAENTRQLGATPIALVPHGPKRWPGRLRRLIRIVWWDARTIASRVPRRARGGL